MNYENITTEKQLADFCATIAGAGVIGFDTEFVSEDTYWPDLCLIQAAAAGRVGVIDVKAIGGATPFWELLARPGHESIVHSGHEEVRFCLRGVGKPPTGLIDVQIAAGLIGLEYPAAYGTLTLKLLGKSLPKGETRTDWRRRPLARRQLDYAAQDVVDLEPLRNAVYERLDALERLDWLAAEMATWQEDVATALARRSWRRVSGISGLSARSLAVVRRLWHWREIEAERANRPVRRVLRDDLIVELARRGTADLRRIRAVRGLQHRHLQQHLPKLAECIEQALSLPEEECPKFRPRRTERQLTVVCQCLATALGSICRRAQLAPSLVGNMQDIRDLVACRLGLERIDAENPPRLAEGWRAEVVGRRIEDLLAGKLSIRIQDPLSEHPLALQPVPK